MILLGAQMMFLQFLGSASVTTDNYIQSGAIDVAGALTINANNLPMIVQTVILSWEKMIV